MTTDTETATIILTPDRELQLAFVRAVLEVEQQHGGQIFIDRAPHCNLWGARVYWPKWSNNPLESVGNESFHNILNYTLELTGEYNNIEERIELVKRTLITSIAKLKAQEDDFQRNRIEELERQLAAMRKQAEEQAKEQTNGN